MKQRRSAIEIRIEILENAMENIKPSYLMAAANLAQIPMRGHINDLKAKGLIEEIKLEEEEIRRDRRTKINYRTTIKGVNILKTFNEVKKGVA